MPTSLLKGKETRRSETAADRPAPAPPTPRSSMDESHVAAVPEEGMALVSALDDALLARHGAAEPKDGASMDGEMETLDDVDMDMDIDVDVFRPSAMLDTRLDEEFGCTRDFGGLWRNGDAEHDHVDLERMLLSESDEELLRLIKQEQASERAGLLSDPLRRHVFAIRAGRVAANEAVDTTQFPPKYSGGAVAKAATGGSVFRHTFGSRSQRFGFANSTTTTTAVTARQQRAAVVASPLVPATTAVAAARDSTPICDPGASEQEDEHEEDDDVDMQADAAAMATAVPAAVAAAASPTTHCSPATVSVATNQETMKEKPVPFKHAALDGTPATPVRPQPMTRSINPIVFGSPDATIPPVSETFHTPLRRAMSSPASSTFLSPSTCDSEKTSFVSLDRMTAIGAAGVALHHHNSESDLLEAPQFRSMSPADELEKVAALHDKGTLGKLDKIESHPSPGAAASIDGDSGSSHDNEDPMENSRGMEDSADRPSISVVVAGSPATPLPPRYIKGPTDTDKRRVHSSTFQSFARSFSFSSAPSASSALD